MELTQALQYLNPVLAVIIGLLWFWGKEIKISLRELFRRVSTLEADNAVSSEKFSKIERGLEKIQADMEIIKQILAQRK